MRCSRKATRATVLMPGSCPSCCAADSLVVLDPDETLARRLYAPTSNWPILFVRVSGIENCSKGHAAGIVNRIWRENSSHSFRKAVLQKPTHYRLKRIRLSGLKQTFFDEHNRERDTTQPR